MLRKNYTSANQFLRGSGSERVYSCVLLIQLPPALMFSHFLDKKQDIFLVTLVLGWKKKGIQHAALQSSLILAVAQLGQHSQSSFQCCGQLVHDDVIGPSVSEPHTSKNTLRTCVVYCFCFCLLAGTDCLLLISNDHF